MDFWTSINEDMKYLNLKVVSKSPRRLNIQHLSGTFQIFLAACGMSIVVFVIEIYWSKRKINVGK